ncbi:hypothetical protein BGX26_006507, partial [Mortierella sp. AD094]
MTNTLIGRQSVPSSAGRAFLHRQAERSIIGRQSVPFSVLKELPTNDGPKLFKVEKPALA